MTMKKLLTGNQAIARGFYEAGGHLVSSYPGSPTVGILDAIKEYANIYSEFSTNEKVALEVAIGSSFAGGKTMVTMKHVGVNIAADPLMTFTQTKVNGSFLLVTGDDPGMSSSQNEQDNRIFGKFANMPIFDPADSEDAKNYVKVALSLSEKYHCPTMLRITSRLCHSRSEVTLSEPIESKIKGFDGQNENYAMIPPNTFPRQYEMKNRLAQISEDQSIDQFNLLIKNDSDTLIITSGISYYNLLELKPQADIYKLGMIYPLNIDALKKLTSKYSKVVVLEELMPFIENELKINAIACIGKDIFSFTGELMSEDIYEGLIKVNVQCDHPILNNNEENTIPRLPMFCSGCPHRPVFDILRKTKKPIIGDIGCYSLGFLPPLEVLSSVISMGASIGITKGMSKIYKKADIQEPIIAVIGDGTFFHSGIPSFINMTHQMENENITLIILNNGLTAMTGGQGNASTGRYTDQFDMHIDIPKLLESCGLDNIQVIDQFKYDECQKAIKEAIQFEGLSIIMTTRPCALNYKIVHTPYYVDPTICIGCRSCVKTNCPPIVMKKYEGIDKLKSSIDEDLCVGCSVCSQVCPVSAIKRRND